MKLVLEGVQMKLPDECKKILFHRHYPGYFFIRMRVGSDLGKDYERVMCFSDESGVYIGDARIARLLCKKLKLRKIQKSRPSDSIASIGFQPGSKKWYGWSHRAICGFGIGDKLYNEKFKLSSISKDDPLFHKYDKARNEYKKALDAHKKELASKDESQLVSNHEPVVEEFVPFILHGTKTIETLDEAKTAAINFASSVS